MDRLIAKAKELGAEKLVLETNRTFVPAIELYRGLGFTRVANYGPYAQMEESVCMKKKIDVKQPLIRSLKIQLDLSFNMVESQIDACPDSLWNGKTGGFVFFQQILHALAGSLFWMREQNGDFDEPFKDREVYPELEKAPVGTVSKEEMRALAQKARRLFEAFFAAKDDLWLFEPNGIYDKITNADAVFGQIRHLMYHAGHCDSALRERGIAAVKWEEYFG